MPFTHLIRLWQLLRETVTEWVNDNAMRLGAALAYYSMFSLAPLLVIAVAIAGAVFGQEAASGELVFQLRTLLGDQGAAAINGMIAGARDPGASRWATLLSVVTLIFGATGVVVELKDSMNAVWGVVPNPNRPWWGIVWDRLASLTIVLGVGFLLLVSLILSAILSAMGRLAVDLASMPLPFAQLLNIVISFVIVTLLFAMIFKLLPDVDIHWADVWLGATITSLLFMVGRELIGMYLGNASIANTYGAAGSLAIVLIWTYYSSLILFLGAEFTKVYARQFGHEIRPRGGALTVAEVLHPTREKEDRAARKKLAEQTDPPPASARHQSNGVRKTPAPLRTVTTEIRRPQRRSPISHFARGTFLGVFLGWLFWRRDR